MPAEAKEDFGCAGAGLQAIASRWTWVWGTELQSLQEHLTIQPSLQPKTLSFFLKAILMKEQSAKK